MDDLKQPLAPLPHSVVIDQPHSLPLTIIEDLIYFDGPVLSHVKDEFGREFLYLYIDDNEIVVRWLLIPINQDLIDQYKSCKTSLRGLCDSHEQLMYVDVAEMRIVNSYLIETKNIPESELTTQESYFSRNI